MFRDLKEYQEIAKIYAEKVSKPEDLDENRNTRGQALRMQRDANKPKTREEVGLKNNVVKKPSPFERKFGAERNQQRLKQSGLSKPSTSEIRAANPKVVPGTRTNEIGAQGGGKPSSGDLSMFKDKKPEVSTMTKQGKPRTKAQMMAAKRIAAGKTISQVKAENQASMKAKAAERHAAFKAKRAEKKGGNVKPAPQAKPVPQEKPVAKATPAASASKKIDGAGLAAKMGKENSAKPAAKPSGNTSALNVSSGIPTRKVTSSTTQSGNTTSTRTKVTSGTGGGTAGLTSSAGSLEANKKKAAKLQAIADKNAAMENYTPYDLVLEYLLSTEQVATIEEANYVMTEMDAETIQGIVEAQKKTLTEKPGDGYIGPKFLNIKNPVTKFINKMRDESPIGGNKRVDDVRKGSGDKKVGEKIYYGK